MLEFTRWITERSYRAGLMAAGLALLPLLAPLSCAVLSLTALRRHPVAGWRAAAFAGILLTLVGWASGMHPLVGVVSAVVIWIPTLAATQVLIGTGSLSTAVRVATIGAFLLAGVWAFAAPLQGEPWLSLLSQMVQPLATQTGADALSLAQRLLVLLPGLVAASLLLVSLGGLFLAMWLHARVQSPGAFGEAFRAMQLGPVLGGVGALSFMAALMGSPQSIAVVAVPASTVFMLQGIAVMHALVWIRRRHRAWLVSGWVALAMFSLWAVMFFALMGLLDTFRDMRRRAAVRN